MNGTALGRTDLRIGEELFERHVRLLDGHSQRGANARRVDQMALCRQIAQLHENTLGEIKIIIGAFQEHLLVAPGDLDTQLVLEQV